MPLEWILSYGVPTLGARVLEWSHSLHIPHPQCSLPDSVDLVGYCPLGRWRDFFVGLGFPLSNASASTTSVPNDTSRSVARSFIVRIVALFAPRSTSPM